MFGRKQKGRRSTNIVFVIFRLFLSLTMFVLLLGGAYSAYKHFSGLDPLKLNPQNLITTLSSIKLTQSVVKQTTKSAPKSVLRFLMVADSHNDNKNLAKALSQAKEKYPDIKFVLGLGDYTEVGTVGELINAKAEFDLSGLRYFLTPGDHDLWDARDKNLSPPSNFNKVFGPNFQSFSEAGFNFIILDNSDNYLGFSDAQLKWLDDTLEKAKQEASLGIFVFLHEPLYHPSSDHSMGKTDPNLKKQAKTLILTLKSAGVKEIVAGDIHYFSYYEEPEAHIPMVTVGAVTSDRNVQSPRYAVGTVFDDGSLSVEDIEIH